MITKIGHTENFVRKRSRRTKISTFDQKREQAAIKNLKYKNPFIEKSFYSSNMDDIYDDTNDYNKKRKRKVSIVYDDMISHAMSNKEAQQVIKELFIRCRKLNISLCFLTQSLFQCSKRREIKLYS